MLKAKAFVLYSSTAHNALCVRVSQGLLLKGRLWFLVSHLGPLWKIVWRLLKTLKRKLPYNPAIPKLGINLQKTKIIQKDTYTSMFVATLFIIAKIRK